jgi:formate dehydrogenase maturation protein FdhE
MAYVALGPADRLSGLAGAAARWQALAAARPDLAPAIALQRRLIERMTGVVVELERTHVRRFSLPQRYLAAKLSKGVPVFSAEPLPMPVATLEPAFHQFCDALSKAGAGDAAMHIRDAVLDGSMEAGALLSASFSRDQEAIRSGALQRGLSANLLWLAAELATSPLAHVLQHATLAPASSPELRAALDSWSFGYCPACGSWPALSEVVAGRGVLRCSFCAAAWTLPADVCTYCGVRGDSLTVLAPLDRGDHRLQVCGGCQGYLKVVDMPELSPFPFLAVTDLETMELDRAAAASGYHRPELRDWRTGAA